MAGKYNTVILDIEGTTTPISFVHDVLFPYVRERAEEFLNQNWESEELQQYVELLREQAKQDVQEGNTLAVEIPESKISNKAAVISAILANIQWQMDSDRKIGALKNFQGYMWRSGYHSGELKGVVYEDVVPALERWSQAGMDIYIYSSGSVPAQKLLFGYSDKGDLLHFFKGHFDTTIGLKVEAESYLRIAQEIGKSPSEILFVSDNVKEIIAADHVGYATAIADRPGNAPLDDESRSRFQVVRTFSELSE
ncbi:2,3-diketo-5-methylthio-1-phosphopentane phosphatase [Basidiobolus meristosporus CBS 931.73]|uniref:Enolase-phosphatase E1 n=1 Tax=Basidiobolus meristosporus CBS 931.73 TaxID=1314790 RepID=A0A1Y1XYM4_9FUNG|nr:2,3-diketo-5-methylthio-1-phosphopentane phosphatase [Basidiobolus meristosporus CBS 931.73]|eukprot:ORX90841.1 2,3-diketo-5-methylthio-1-phosphopentane phosphatase [Basidiobolus meristosporus CBS 931.73]